MSMFKRGGLISRSFNAPHGVNINGEERAGSKLKRKFSWSSPKVRSAVSVGVLTHKPVVLKEGYLCKPGFFRFVSCIEFIMHYPPTIHRSTDLRHLSYLYSQQKLTIVFLIIVAGSKETQMVRTPDLQSSWGKHWHLCWWDQEQV